MRLAGSVARIVMTEWARRLLKILDENKIRVWMAAFYVDDVRLLTSIIDKGARWETKEKKFKKRDDWLAEDEKENMSDERRTSREIRKVMNSIFQNIQFTMEIPEDFPENRLPTLDFTCWIDQKTLSMAELSPTPEGNEKADPSLASAKVTKADQNSTTGRVKADPSAAPVGVAKADPNTASAGEARADPSTAPTGVAKADPSTASEGVAKADLSTASPGVAKADPSTASEEVAKADHNSTTAGGSKILYSFFEKSMNSPFCILERSALPDNTKISSLSQEIIRRMLNTCEQVPQEERNNIIENFISKLKRSGYRQDQVKNIVEAGLIGYERKLEKARASGQGIHRSAKSTEGQRYKKKLLDKNKWFKKKRNEQEEKTESTAPKKRKNDGAGVKGKRDEKTPLTVLFVPKTQGGELAKRMRLAEQEIEALTGDRIKVVERAGTMLKRILSKSNPWAGGQCGRENCLVCRYEEGGGDCRRRNATYRTQCLACKAKNGKQSYYFGETSRTPFERGQEHENDYKKNQEDSHMVKHAQEDHPGEERPRFSMKILRGHTSAFVRQIHEAVLIEMNQENVLNSKGEFNRCQLPRLGVKMGERNIDCEEKVKELNENEIFSSIHDKKRREYKGELQEPSGKKRKINGKYKMSSPELKKAIKRRREDQADPSSAKRRKEKADLSTAPVCFLTECAQESEQGCRQDRVDSGEAASTRNIVWQKTEEKVSDQKRRKNEDVEDNLSAENSFNISNKNINVGSLFKIENAQPYLNSKPKENSTPSTTKEKELFQFKKPSPNVKQMVSIFEATTRSVSKTTKNATTKLTQHEYKANQLVSPATTTPPNRIRKTRSRKTIIAPDFNYKKISDHFEIKVKVKTSTASPPEEKIFGT